ncbi:MAG TPA: NAD(+) diphosphatase [Polyangiaceae bacterium]|nr:NAD(+) diphosphatase [Polyangiaceae bacterium]
MPSATAARNALLIVLRDTQVLVLDAETAPTLPTLEALRHWLPSSRPRHLVARLGESDVFAVEADQADVEDHRLQFVPVRSLFGVLDGSLLDLVGRSLAVVEFEATHRFCGRCASPLAPITGERGKRCLRCNLSFYPRIPPAVITLVEHEGRLLLARSARFKTGVFSAVAGFVEIGESLEQAAMREVREEVGVEIADLRYFGSQPWPFGRSLMVGYFGRYLSGEIRVDGSEIVEAAWFHPTQLPLLPPPISIARQLIDSFVAANRLL